MQTRFGIGSFAGIFAAWHREASNSHPTSEYKCGYNCLSSKTNLGFASQESQKTSNSWRHPFRCLTHSHTSGKSVMAQKPLLTIKKNAKGILWTNERSTWRKSRASICLLMRIFGGLGQRLEGFVGNCLSHIKWLQTFRETIEVGWYLNNWQNDLEVAWA